MSKITAKPTTEKVADDIHFLIVQTEDDVPVLRRFAVQALLKAFGGTGRGGVGIRSIEQTVTSEEDGGVNEITITMTDSTKMKFQIRNGSKGSDGPAGADGAAGPAGPAGADGYTPVKGTDYFTDDEIEEIVNRVVAQVGTGGGTVEELQNAMEVSF